MIQREQQESERESARISWTEDRNEYTESQELERDYEVWIGMNWKEAIGAYFKACSKSLPVWTGHA
jgi:hypothetical protein